ncbi:hypothetical protein A0J48_014405 [Sphaerospermopsis aphanizomenoides BCCUSP55]|uniref:hypothetical protein n=1 Tax=Sphaerospermopsis aphanizomenoides TaxID=459663 RepID=UPI0019058B8A|nr:hypothetical protein [Sphaerospermopsis aphanizomenoides]MBK1988714.1 hypothetical protein [Sphaerospermopsis aphanizomenoides BCCUSP55]
MGKHSRQLKQKATRIHQPSAGARKKIAKKSQKQSRWRSWLLSTLALTILLSSVGLIIAIGWFSILFILNPEQVSWLNEFLPTWAQIPVNQKDIPQTLAEIQQTLNKQNRIAGESLSLDTVNNDDNQPKKLFLLPVFQKRNNCQSDCQELVEIRVYQRSKDLEFRLQPQTHYNLVTQISITGVTKSLVESSLNQNDLELEKQGEKINLPLTEIKAFEDAQLPDGFWFYLRGEHKIGDSQIAYGQIVHYNTQLRSLQQILSWKNPNGQLPKWQQVTGSDQKEIVIDQTEDLEPNFQVYQLKTSELVSNSLILVPIDFKSEFDDFGYQKSLTLARNGLWTPAYAWLTSLGKQRKTPFPESVQAQIDFIRLHAEFTKIQADKSWANPSQKVITYLIDGRWEQALQVLTTSPYSGQEISNLLKSDRGKLWNRTTVALRLNPNRRAVLAWAYLMLVAQRGEERANSWLEGQPNINEETLSDLQDLLAKLNDGVTNDHQSQIVGGVQLIPQINNQDWLSLDSQTDLKITANQVWYQINVSAFHDGKNWLTYPFNNFQLPKFQTGQFWRKILGIVADPTMQIVVWLPNGEQQIKTATIKAVKMQSGVLQLLAAGDPIPKHDHNSIQPKPLALTSAALEWVQPSPVTIRELYQQNPPAVQAILPAVWRSLQQSGGIPGGQVPRFEVIKEKMDNWPVQMIDVTNDGNVEVVLTIADSAITALTRPANGNTGVIGDSQRPRTVIMLLNGKVIYSDFAAKSPQRLTAIAKLTSDQSLALLVENADRYSLRRWSKTNQRLE